MKAQSWFVTGLIAATLIVSASAPAIAQTQANGPYYATPSWDQTLPAATRFIVLTNMNGQAVLDRETGLVWERTPSSFNTGFRSTAVTTCMVATTGGRQGWRLPRVDELLSLADATNSASDQIHLAPGHPFLGIALNTTFWAADRIPANLTDGGIIVFFTSSQPGGRFNNVLSFQFPAGAWCVRGGGGSQIQ